MEFWKHVQLPQQSDGCSFPHTGNLNLSVRDGDRTAKLGGETWADLGYATDPSPGMSLKSLCVRVPAREDMTCAFSLSQIS